jgi:hypothetical protein
MKEGYKMKDKCVYILCPIEYLTMSDKLKTKTTDDLQVEINKLNNEHIEEIEKLKCIYDKKITSLLATENIDMVMGGFVDTNDRILYSYYNSQNRLVRQYSTYDIFTFINEFIDFKELHCTNTLVNNLYEYINTKILTSGEPMNNGWKNTFKSVGFDILDCLYFLDIKELDKMK